MLVVLVHVCYIIISKNVKLFPIPRKLYEGAVCYHKILLRIYKAEDHKRYFLRIIYINRGTVLINILNIFRDITFKTFYLLFR